MSSAKKPLHDTEEHYGIKILRDGTWLYQGTPITRIGMVRLFSSVLSKKGADYWLITPYEKGKIEVEDAPFTAVEVRVEESDLCFRTNLDDWVTVDAEHPIRVAFHPETGEPAPYVYIRDGLEARILRPVYYELVKMAMPAKEDKKVFGVTSRGHFFMIGRAE